MLASRLVCWLVASALLLSVAEIGDAAPSASSGKADIPAGPPVVNARSAILIDARTGVVLYEMNADEPSPPASLTKLMTAHLALREIEEGKLSLSQVVVPSPEAWAENMPAHSSLMFLGPNQKLRVDELLTGLVVDSGNDAAVEVAHLIAGSVPGFVDLMNQEAARLGYRVMHFVDPSGISASNVITAREYADFARQFVLAHPGSLGDFFSVREFTYPLPVNLTGGNHEKPITQLNRNSLLGRYTGVDGLKTGYIDESGYNMAATAVRDGMRLIAVILGVRREGTASGTSLRAAESASLLDYGFRTFAEVPVAFREPSPVRVWKGKSRSVTLRADSEPVVVVRKDHASEVHAVTVQATDVYAPVSMGHVLGSVLVTIGSTVVERFPLRAEASVDRSGLAGRTLDSIIVFLRGIHPEGAAGPPQSQPD